MLTLLLAACSAEPAGLDVMIQELAPDPVVSGEDVTASLHVSWADDGEDVTDAVVTLTPWMSAHGHGIDDEVLVEELGDGLFTADFALTMPGTWELRVDVDDGLAAGSVEVEVQ